MPPQHSAYHTLSSTPTATPVTQNVLSDFFLIVERVLQIMGLTSFSIKEFHEAHCDSFYSLTHERHDTDPEEATVSTERAKRTKEQ